VWKLRRIGLVGAVAVVLAMLTVALLIAGLAAVAGGSAMAKLTGRSQLVGGLRQFTAAFLATGTAYTVGHLLSGHVS